MKKRKPPKKKRRKAIGNITQTNISNSQINIGTGNTNQQITKVYPPKKETVVAPLTTIDQLPAPTTPKWIKITLNSMVVVLALLTLYFIYCWIQAEAGNWEPLVSMVSTVLTFLLGYMAWRYRE